MAGFIGAVLPLVVIGYLVTILFSEYRRDQKMRYEAKRKADTYLWLKSLND